MDHLCQNAQSKIVETELRKDIQEKKFVMKQPIDHMENSKIETFEMETEIRMKSENNLDSDIFDNKEDTGSEKRPKKHSATEELSIDDSTDPPTKIWRGLRYKSWAVGGIQPATKYKKPTDREITEVIKYFRHNIADKLPTNSFRTKRSNKFDVVPFA